jgi:hypothetical protein
MTTRNKGKRLKKLERNLITRPIQPEVGKAAYDRFRTTGELPEEQHIAALVVDLVRGGLDPESWAACNGDEKRMIRTFVCAPPRPEDKVMDLLLREAVWAPEQLRQIARFALTTLAETGLDVTQPIFAGSSVTLPEYGSAGIHVLGLPECLAQPPYVEQANRMIQRFAELRKLINQDDPRWFEALDDAIVVFREFGELPEDQLLHDTVLACEEFQCLQRHYYGDSDPELIAAFDRVASASSEEREVAIEQLQEMARGRRLVFLAE